MTDVTSSSFRKDNSAKVFPQAEESLDNHSQGGRRFPLQTQVCEHPSRAPQVCLSDEANAEVFCRGKTTQMSDALPLTQEVS